jgi:hypothetical protein
MLDISFTSSLPESYRGELERLMFFHPHQPFLSSSIESSIDSYGLPRIEAAEGNLVIHVSDLEGVQSLFALAPGGEQPELIGLMIFTRISAETIVLLHMVVRDDYSSIGEHANAMAGVRMLDRLRRIAASLRGVRSIRILYGKGAELTVRH